MIQDELKYRIVQALGLPPTPEQGQALDVFTQFMTDRSDQVVMILRGSAGTGKTTLAGAIVKAMAALKQKLILLAPTGRAAKVFSSMPAMQPIRSIGVSTVRSLQATYRPST